MDAISPLRGSVLRAILQACCRGALIASLGSSRGGGEHCRPVATGRTGVAQQRSNDRTAVPGCAMASLIIAGQEDTEGPRWGVAAN